MRAELKWMWAPSVVDVREELSGYEPEDPMHFGFEVQAFIGEAGDERSDAFNIFVCSPSWLTEHWEEAAAGRSSVFLQTAEGVAFGAGLVFMREWNFTQFDAAVRDVCAKAEGHTWGDLANRVGRLLPWEFDYGYDEEVDAARLREGAGAVDVRVGSVRTKEQFIERVLAAVGTPERLRTDNWDAFEEQVRGAGRPVRLLSFDPRTADLDVGRRILRENGLLIEDPRG